MFSNPANSGTCASTAASSHWQDTKFDPSRWLDAKFDFTFPRRKPEIDIKQLVEGVYSLNISEETVKDRGPNNTTPPRRRGSFQQGETQKYETSYDSDASAHSGADVRGYRRSSSPAPPRAARANPSQTNHRSHSEPASSFLPSPPARSPQTLCSAPTKQGSPCQRSTTGRFEDWQCHSHRKSPSPRQKIPAVFPESKPVLSRTQSGGQLRVYYSEWIPSYLQAKTQKELREAMRELPTESDEPGYIYAYERLVPVLGDSGDLNPFTIKVGRAGSGKGEARLPQRRKACAGCFHGDGMRERGWWPGNIDRNSSMSYTASTKSYIDHSNLGPEGKYCHKVEKLVLLELGDIARNSVHLLKGFAEQSTTALALGRVNSDEGPDIPRPPEGPKPGGKLCSNCGITHREIFKLKRIPGHDMTGKEWENVVLPIIERWGRFVTVFGDSLSSISWE